MASSTFHISSLLDKMSSFDKDFRFMATNDLIVELQKDSIKLDDDMERKIIKMVLKLLEDKNGEVQNLAVKCLGPLINKIKPKSAESILSELCTNMFAGNEQLRDISSIALKTVINNFPMTNIWFISSRELISNLVKILNRKDDAAIQLEVLDIIGDILNRFGNNVDNEQALIEASLIPLLSGTRLAVRKRAAVALSYLTVICSPVLFAKIMTYLIEQISTNKTPSITQSYIQCLGAISRTSGLRIGQYIPKIIPLLVNICNIYGGDGSVNNNNINTEESDEMIEHCFQTFETLIRSCSHEITVYTQELVTLALTFIEYDPNYNYGDDSNDEYMDSASVDIKNQKENDFEPSDEYEDEDGSASSVDENDEDMSWKVRRAAAKCLKAQIELSPRALLSYFYDTVSPRLISRFKEREENVKIDLIQVYLALLKQTQDLISHEDADPNLVTDRPYLDYHHLHIAADEKIDGMETDNMNLASHDTLENIVKHKLNGEIGPLLKMSKRLIRNRSAKVRQITFNLLTKLVLLQTRKTCLKEYLGMLISGVIYTLSNGTSSSPGIKIDALSFLGCLLSTQPAANFYPYIKQLVQAILNAINDPFYKIVAEALYVNEKLICILRPTSKSENALDYFPYIQPLYQATLNRLNTTDIDQEVKERAIACMARIIQVFGEKLEPSQIEVCLSLINERLKNEITRLAAIKAIKTLVESPFCQIDISRHCEEYLKALSHFLRKNNRALKIISLTTLTSLINRSLVITDALINQHLINEIPSLISDNDLKVTDLALQLLAVICKSHPSCIFDAWSESKYGKGDYKNNFTQAVCTLLYSPLLQGDALSSVLQFFACLVQAVPHLCNEIIELITKPIYNRVAGPQILARTITASRSQSGSMSESPPKNSLLPNNVQDENLNKQALLNLAKVIAVIASTLPLNTSINPNKIPNEKQIELVTKFTNEIKIYLQNVQNNSAVTNNLQSPNTKIIVVFSALALGEIGKRCDLYSYFKSKKEDICQLLSYLFKSPSEDIKFATTYSLGNIGLGNLTKFIPFVLSEIQKHTNSQYLSLFALKEILTDIVTYNAANYNHGDLREQMKPIWHFMLKGPKSEGINLGMLAMPEESIRNATAECLGLMCLLDPDNLIPLISSTLDLSNASTPLGNIAGTGENLSSTSPNPNLLANNLAKCTCLSAIINCVASNTHQVNNKESGSFDQFPSTIDNTGVVTKVKRHRTTSMNYHQHDKVDQILKLYATNFLACLRDADLNVRKMALILLNCTVHNKPWLVRDDLDSIMALLYNETKIRKELIREVEMGPFKHSVDDGLDLRKASYECMYTLIDSPTCFEKLDLNNFLDHVEMGLMDHYDIKMLTYLMLSRLIILCPPNLILQRVDRLLEPLKQVLLSKVKANAVKQEYEKQEELKRCVLRVAICLMNISDADKHQGIVEFQKLVKGNPELNTLYESIKEVQTLLLTKNSSTEQSLGNSNHKELGKFNKDHGC